MERGKMVYLLNKDHMLVAQSLLMTTTDTDHNVGLSRLLPLQPLIEADLCIVALLHQWQWHSDAV